MRPFTVKDIYTHMPGHVRARVAQEIRNVKDKDARFVHEEALQAIRELNHEARIQNDRRKAVSA